MLAYLITGSHPTEMQTLEQLDGNWKLVYTSNSELIAVLALSRLPFVTIGDVTQRIDAASMTVENKVSYCTSGPEHVLVA